MYVPASRGALDRGPEIKPYQKTLFDRLRDLADKHNLVNEVDEEEECKVTHEQISSWFSQGNDIVWNHLEPISLGLFSLTHPIRYFCVEAMLNKWFDKFILLAIIGNSICLAANNPLDSRGDYFFYYSDFVFNIIFLTEFVVKIIALGALSVPAGYFNDPWNRLDFIVIILAWLPIILDASGSHRVSNFSFIRVIRILKVLKTVNNIPGLKRLVKSVLDAIPRLISVGYVLTFIFLLFGILGTQLYMGEMRNRCYPKDTQLVYGDSYIPSPDLCCQPTVNGQQCPKNEKCLQHYPETNKLNHNYNEYINFDNIPNSFLSIFVIISLEGWTDIMYAIMNTSGIANAGYFIFLVFTGSYFVINLFIAVIYQSYIDTIDDGQSNDKSDPSRRSTKSKFTLSLVAYLHSEQYIPDFIYEFFTYNETYTTIKQYLAVATDTAEFHWGIVTLIICNLTVLAIQANGTVDEETNRILGIINVTCTFIFVFELILRLIATDLPKFFKVGFNIVDTIIVIVSVVEVFATNAQNTLSAFRTLRVFRTFKLLTRWESLQQLVNAVFKSGPGLGYFCIILSLDIFVCALAGIALFAGKLGGDNFKYGNSRENFDDLFFALLTTFQIVSGENWNDVLYRSMEYDPIRGAIFFVLVYFIGNLIVLNLFLAILLENFSEGRYRKDKISYYEQLDKQRDVQVVFSTLWSTLTSILKKQVWIAFGYFLCQFLLPRHWSGNTQLVDVNEGNEDKDGNSSPDSVFDYDADDENQNTSSLRRNSDRIIRTTQFNLESNDGIPRTDSTNEITPTNLRESSKRLSKRLSSSKSLSFQNSDKLARKSIVSRQQSVWGGWDIEKEKNNLLSKKFLEDDSLRRSILGDIICGQYRRGNRYFNDCFLGIELVDILLDRGIVSNSTEGVAMGQELLFRRKLLPVWIQDKDDLENKSDHDDNSINTPVSQQQSIPQQRYNTNNTNNTNNNSTTTTNNNKNNENESDSTTTNNNSNSANNSANNNNSNDNNSPNNNNNNNNNNNTNTNNNNNNKLQHKQFLTGNKKFSAIIEAQFRDDRSLYRLSDQGEQVTEWLMSSHEAKKTMVLHRKKQKLNRLNSILEDKSLYIFDNDNPIRQFCGKIILHKYFEFFVVFMIIASSIFLALDSPHLKRPSTLASIVSITDVFFTSFFIVEMLIKMIAMGVISTPKAYLKNGWNVLDFIVIFFSILSLSLKAVNLSFLKAFRATRALRPLRMVSRSPGMKAVVNAIIMVIPPLANFVLVVSVFLFTFAILGASLFRDKLYSCVATGNWRPDDDDFYSTEYRYTKDKDECIGTIVNSGGYIAHLSWKTAEANFDNMGNAFLTLFELSNMENWPGLMYPAMDIPSRTSDAPILNNTKYYALYFVAFIIVGAFFITNLFVGIIVHKFNRARMMDSGSVFLTDDQRRWLSDMKAAMSAQPQNQVAVPSDTELFGIRRPIYYLVNSNYFAYFMDVFIIINIFVMTLEHYNQTIQFTNALYIINTFFAGLFALELLLRLIAIGPKGFIKDNWCRLDFLIVTGAILDISGLALVFNVTIFRVLRVGRILRLLKSSKNMIVLLKTLFFSLPSLVNVGSLLFLAFFVFTIVGMNLFGDVPRDGINLSQYANFEYFGSSMLLLIRCMTGEGWNSIMHYLKDQGHPVAVPYFALFLITCPYMLLNLFIAVILENFEAALAADPDKVQQKNLEDFIEAWAQIHDELGAEDNDRLPCYTLVKLIHMLPPPLGIKNLPETELALGDNGQRQLHRNFVLSFIRSLDLKEDSKGRIYFVDVIAALVRRSQIKLQGGRNVVAAMSIQQRQELQYRIRKMTKNKMINKLESKMKGEIFTEIDLAVEFNAAMAMQAMWRGKQSREKLRAIIAQMIQQQRDSKLQEKDKKKTRRTLSKILWHSSRRWRSGSKSNLSVDSGDSPTDNSTVVTKKSGVKSEIEDGSKSQDRKSPYPERRKSFNPDEKSTTEDDDSMPPPVSQLEFMTTRPISQHSMQTESSKQSWLAPLRSPFSSRPASFRRETSQLSGISGITLSSWESMIDRNMRKQQQQQSQSQQSQNGGIDEEGENKETLTPEHTEEYYNSVIDSIPEDQPVTTRSRRYSLLLREDSRAQWLPTEVSSSRAILQDSHVHHLNVNKDDINGNNNINNNTNNNNNNNNGNNGNNNNNNLTNDPNSGTNTPTKDRSLKRSRTLSSLPTTLAQLTGMGHYLTRQESNRSRKSECEMSEADVVIERSGGIIRLGSVDSPNDGVVIDAPVDLEINMDDKPYKRYTISGDFNWFSPKSPREIQKSRSRRRTIARGNSNDSPASGDSPEVSPNHRKFITPVYLSQTGSSRSLGRVSSSRSVISYDSPTGESKISHESDNTNPSKDITLSTITNNTPSIISNEPINLE